MVHIQFVRRAVFREIYARIANVLSTLHLVNYFRTCTAHGIDRMKSNKTDKRYYICSDLISVFDGFGFDKTISYFTITFVSFPFWILLLLYR